jgi:hypothetical protein
MKAGECRNAPALYTLRDQRTSLRPREAYGVRGMPALARAERKQAQESGADRGLMGHAEVVELAQGRIAGLDRLMPRPQL